MKNLLLLFVLFAATGLRAQVISGIYLGKLTDDSLRKKQTYELALNEYRGRIMGYSYSSFVKNDTFYYSIREIKARRDGAQLIVEDDKMIVNNFPHVDKRVHRTSVIPLTGEDTLRTFNGTFSTNKTRQFYSVKGEVEAQRETDSSRSALIGHLRELNILGNDRGGRSEASPTAVARVGEEKPKAPKRDRSAEAMIKKDTPGSDPKKTAVNSVSGIAITPFSERRNVVQQTLDVRSDSLVLSFYDNGVVDGDSISVYLNGALVLEKTRLTATATRRTVPVPAGEVELKLVAESLGTLPPNTGLLVIRDGENQYNLNFSADLQSNASVILRKRK